MSELERTCAYEIVDAVKGRVLEDAERIQERFYALKDTYEQCRALPVSGQAECLRHFVNYAVGLVESLRPELAAKRVLLRYFALARLEDYYQCRNPEITSSLGDDQLCAARLLIDTIDRLQPVIAHVEELIERLDARYVACQAYPEELKPTCLVLLFRETTTVIRGLGEQAIELRPIIVTNALELLESYNQCRQA